MVNIKINNDEHLHCNTKRLIHICVKYFQDVDSKLKKKHIRKFIKEIITNYYSFNSFHNFKHAFEVFQMSYYLQTFNNTLSKDDRKLLLITALCHDLNHIGESNRKMKTYVDSRRIIHQVNTDYEDFIGESEVSDLCSYSSLHINPPKETGSSVESAELIYSDIISISESYDSLFEISNDDSYNEKVHITRTTVLVSKYIKHFFDSNTLSNIELINTKINSMILSTDLKLHQKYMEIIDSQHECNNIAQMILILKLADISHPCRPFKVHCYWVFKLVEENEHEFNDTLSYLANDSLTFMRLFVKELLMKFVDKYNIANGLDVLCKNFNDNLRIWKSHLENK